MFKAPFFSLLAFGVSLVALVLAFAVFRETRVEPVQVVPTVSVVASPSATIAPTSSPSATVAPTVFKKFVTPTVADVTVEPTE